MLRLDLYDNPQQAMGFLLSQTAYIEQEVYRIQYPEIIYQQLIPIDTSAGEWAKSVTYFSLDKVGTAQWLSNMASDIPFADVNRNKFEQGIEMAGIGYTYTLEEVGQAMMIPGMNLTAERAEAARFAYEMFMDNLAYKGSTMKNFTGLFNNTNVTVVTAATGASGSTHWSQKTADEIISDVQNALTGVYEGSLTVEMADTVLLPIGEMQKLANVRIPNTYGNALDYLAKYNLYTFNTGAPLTIRGVLGLDSAGADGGGRMICYRRDPRVLKLHVPMPHRFLTVFQRSGLQYDIPGIFRTGSVEIRRPGAVRYVDGISGVGSP
jgi:hypothetical protein